MRSYLDFEKPVAELEAKVEELRAVANRGGAVSIGGSQTGISASDGPSGWNTIGTASATFFDPARTPPALLAPGDRMRLRAIKVIR